MSDKVRVLVVDDSAYSRQTIKKMLESDPGIEVVGTAENGVSAMSKAMRLKPDLVTLDFEMPEMDGFSFLRWMMREMPTPVMMVSSYSDSKTVFKALELGAVDFIAKPSKRASSDLRVLEKDIIRKALGVKDLKLDVLSRNLKLMESATAAASEATAVKSRFSAVAIGTSTGGPPALQIVLSKLPGDFPSAVLISQHMPKGFTKPFAERLDKVSGLRVKEAEDGEPVEKGKALVCPGGYHMTFKRGGRGVRVALKESTLLDKYVPSVDMMMLSAGEQYGDRMVGVLLTGMGSDGKDGMVELHSRGGYTIAESEETAVVFGMPGEVIGAGAAKKVLPIQDIPGEIIKVVMGDRRSS